MASFLDGSESFTGINWWIGQVAPREYWAKNTLLKNDKDVGVAGRKGDINVYPNRVKVRVVGYHDQIEDPDDLPFATVMGILYSADPLFLLIENLPASRPWALGEMGSCLSSV